MVEYKSESELVISESDVMVKQRYAFKISRDGTQQFNVTLPIPVRVAKGRDKFGPLPVKIISSNQLRIIINRKLTIGSVHAVEITLLVSPEITRIGGLGIIEWGSLDLYRIQMIQKPFQVLGFGKMLIKDKRWIFSDNLNEGISTNIGRFRSSRIEIGSKLQVKLQLKMFIDCRDGGRVQKIHCYGPTTSKRQKTKLLTPGIEVFHDRNGNPRYNITKQINREQLNQITIEWLVTVDKGFESTTDLGTMKALNIVTKENEKFQSYLNPSQFWEVNHPIIRKIVGTVNDKTTIYNKHRFLFEFANRKLKYRITDNRQSAVTALENKTGDCSEYADLLVTLHRAAGIPSRVVEGIILEKDKQMDPEGHAWVEFLTTKGWMPCDATWGIPLSITSQHIEFSHQMEAVESKIYELEYTGNIPKITYQLSWTEV